MDPRVYPVPAGVVIAFVMLVLVLAIALVAWFTGDGASSVRHFTMPPFCPPVC